MYFLFGLVANESKEPDDSRSSHMCSYRARQITMGLLLRVVVRKMVIELAEAGRVIVWAVNLVVLSKCSVDVVRE